MRIAIVGSGVSGIGAAWLLSPSHSVDLFEAEPTFGGHAHTVDVAVGQQRYPVDTGFQVYNERTYPNLIRFFDRLGVDFDESDMSFSVHVEDEDVEWSGTNLNTLFAQRKNITNPRFLQMLAGVVRFSHDANRLLADASLETMTLRELLTREGYPQSFTDWYLLPMGAAIWSTPAGRMLDYPAATFLRFCDNHGLLHITGKPIWRSVRGGSRTYVERALATLSGEAHCGEAVERVVRTATGVCVSTPRRTATYDAVIMATHPPQTLSLLADDATADERRTLSAFGYQPNPATLHGDTSFMPKERRAWASWNWFADSGECKKERMALTYWINGLQKIGDDAPPIFETLNPHKPYDEALTYAPLLFEHPLFTSRAIEAQHEVAGLQGAGGLWFAGAWQRYGFHEDGLLSSVRVAEAMGATLPWADELDASRTRVLDIAPSRRKPAAAALGAPDTEGAGS